MRKYLITYLVESKDSAEDREHKIEASNIVYALMMFQEKIRLYKRILSIEELSN